MRSERTEYPPDYLEFISLFNNGKFFEAHEVLEKEWHRSERRNDFYKGLIQLAAAFHHLGRREFRGARELLASSSRYLSPYLPYHQGIRLDRLVEAMEGLSRRLDPPEAADWGEVRPPELRLEKEKP
jgi:predicted metal-dependent hydrolase